MKFSNEVLEDMEQRKNFYNARYAAWYVDMSNEFYNLKAYSEKLVKKAERIRSCLNFWQWDVYHNNKLMDLKKVNRCMNSRFCPNCRKWDLAGSIHNLSKPLNKMLQQGYYPYLVTLTIPNVLGNELRDTIDKMNKAFRKFFGYFNYPLTGTTKGFSERLVEVEAALKVLEITYNSTHDTYHPHFHCIFFSQDYDESIFIKDIPGGWSINLQAYSFYSLMDIQIMKLWTLTYTDQRVTTKNYDLIKPEDLYICDIREMDASGIVEVLKYTFKDTDIENYEVFKTLNMALENKRIRQGYGLLYNLKLEGETDGNKLSIFEFLNEIEDPEEVVIKQINKLVNDYREYEKISRSKAYDI